MPSCPARDALYKRIGIMVMEQAVWIPYVYPTYTAVYQPFVHGYYNNGNMQDPFEMMWLSH